MTRVECKGPTLVAALRQQVADKPDAQHLHLLRDDGTPEPPLTFAELLQAAEAVAWGLRARGVEPKQNVALMLPTGHDFFFSFLGVLLAGAVPVPIYPPVKINQLEDYAQRQVGILRNAEVRALVTLPQAQHLARLLQPKVPSLEAIVRTERLAEDGARDRKTREPATVEPGDLGLIQYTSGSTGDPKGVTLTHDNLIANVRAIGEAMEVNDSDVVVSWLPLYHDMGLIGCWLFAICHGLPIVSFSPLSFLRQPKRWLQAIDHYRGTLSPAPNFAYELCLRRVRDHDLKGLDLSSWRGALNGAEPVNPETVERFCDRFEPYGFRRTAMKPVYGLAENAVALTFPPPDQAPQIDRIDREAFQQEHRAVSARPDGADGDDGKTLRFVAVGRPLAGNELRLVDDDGEPVPERVEGNIQFRGPSATPGYYRNPKATAAIRTEDGWTRTGDRGYAAGGNLYITGRSKDVIIKAGRNIHPAEVEAIAGEVGGVRKGCVAAFGVANPRTGSEDLVVIAETRKKDPEVHNHLAVEIRRRISKRIKVAPDVVELVPPHTVPKTPSGKLRRAETRDRYLNQMLTTRRVPAWLQVLRLAAAGLWIYLLTRLWRGRRD